MFDFRLSATDGAARAGVFSTPHGDVPTPAFMPVGTQGAVKGVDPAELEQLGATMILSNTYHLYLRPGAELVRELGELHAFMRWRGPILTDSGGFQVFSLAATNEIDDDHVVFRSHIDGSRHVFTPESVMETQRALGADVVMAFDQCPPGGCTHGDARRATERTLAWLERCRVRFAQLEHEREVPRQTLFPVLQGNIYDDLRREQARAFADLGEWDGWAIGGLSVGEAKPDMWRTLDVLDAEIPRDRPRYLMGVGYPDDMLEAIARGCDMFDCVAPTRNARHGTAWTAEGQVNMKAARFKRDTRPVDPECDCPVCARFDRAFLRHLFVAGEMLALRLLSLHNLRFLIRLGEQARAHIGAGTFGSWSGSWLERYRGSRV
ncbi:MAG: tRNA guanosine(34) transglycosylase Tgt [Gemmatimonadetes bacterium]|nr:tRNA guanosine(34) transglycosylase Tgt [Gemmatimonadota bacterium]